MKKSISSLELAALVNELQSLLKGRITQIYHQDQKEQPEILLQIHISDQPKQLLKIIPGKLLCLTRDKDVPIKPSSFCMQLRKYIDNAYIKAIEQKDTERIIIFELDKKQKYFLIIELFSKGNVVLTDENYQIIGALERQEWKDRVVKVGEKYLFPSSEINWKKLSEKELSEILKKSDRKNLATSLATEIGLGGLYAEEVCKLSNIDKDKLPTETEPKEIKSLLKNIKELLLKIEKPQGFIYPEQITPFELTGEKYSHKFPTYNQAIDTLNPFVKVSPYQQKIKSLEKMIFEQEEAVKKQELVIEQTTQKAELIYEKYLPIQKLLDIVKEMRKTKDWKDIEIELKKEKRIINVDLKNKKVTLNL